ncbi:MAG: radical SAM protein, partial [Verrucomicrobiia bacterium]
GLSRQRRFGLFTQANRRHLLRPEFTLRFARLRKLIPMGENFKYVFGPVPSRRLGRSLGVDLVPLKVCSYDCIYCQLGRTTKKTVVRKEWVPTAAVLDELKCKLTSRPDYTTFSGSGEPTLHSGLGEIIMHVRKADKNARGRADQRLVALAAPTARRTRPGKCGHAVPRRRR